MRLRASFLILSIAAAAEAAAQFETGQAARLIVGQPSFTSERPAGTLSTALGGVGGVAAAANKLFVLDSNRIGAGPVNQRLLIYNNLSSFVLDPVSELPQGSTCPACVGLPDVVLGQPDLDTTSKGLEKGFNNPTAVASDGIRIALADTDNNRVLLWLTIPTVNGTLPDVVVGQPDFKTSLPRAEQTGLRGPQGVWFANGKLIIADTQNGRVLIYNSIPTSNGARADVVLGQPDFNTRPNPDLTLSNVKPTASNMLDPTSATTAGNRLIVTDLGYNRVLIYNSIPTSNAAAADLVLGQPDMTSDIANNSNKDSPLCPVAYKDKDGNDVFPPRCGATLSFPRFAFSDGTRLYIADGGNDRVLVFNTFPTQNGATADVVLGQKDTSQLIEGNGAGLLRAPTALATDGVNLFVADPFSRRVLIFTPNEALITDNGIVNAASFEVHAQGSVVFDGAPKKDDDIKVTIKGKDYEYKVVDGDTLDTVRDAFLHMLNEDPSDPYVYGRGSIGEAAYATGRVIFDGAIKAGVEVILRIQDRIYKVVTNDGDTPASLVDYFIYQIQTLGRDPDVYPDHDPTNNNNLRLTARVPGPDGNNINYEAYAPPDAGFTAVSGVYLEGGTAKLNLLLVARNPGADGNNIDLATTLSSNAGVTLTTSGATLTGGNDATEVPAGTQISIFGKNLAPSSVSADPTVSELPRELAGVQVYINGIKVPLYFVTPTQINAQMPFEIDGASASIYVRTPSADGQVMASNAKAVSVPRAAPGLYANSGLEPRPGVVVHGMDRARGTIAIDNGGDASATVPAGASVQVIVNGRTYQYTSVDGDTTDAIRDKIADLINNTPDPEVEASSDRVGFLSARARVTFEGTIKAGDVSTITVNDRAYNYTVKSTDNLTTVANRLIAAINAGAGDPDVTAKLSSDVGVVAIDIIARALGTSGNSISLTIHLTANAGLVMKSDAKDDKLTGGSTPSAIVLTARKAGVEGNDVMYSAFASGGNLTVTARTSALCCGNDLFAPVTAENPASPGEIIVVFGTGLGLTKPSFREDGDLETGKKVPGDPQFLVPFNPDDFVSSLCGGKTAQVDFVGLMPGQVGVYQINLILNSDMPDDPMTPCTIAQGLFVSNPIAVPLKNRVPRRTQ